MRKNNHYSHETFLPSIRPNFVLCVSKGRKEDCNDYANV